MSYSVAGLGDADCVDAQAWKAAQLACNAGDLSQCALADQRACLPPDVCPSGTLVREIVPRQNRTTGMWGTVAIAYCASPVAPAAVSQSVKTNWGIYLAAGVAALIVYKVATR